MKDFSGVFIDDGIGFERAATRYARRRDALRREHPYVVLVGFSSSSQTSRWHPPTSSVLQDALVAYYTGINQPDVAVVLRPNSKGDVLFLPEKNSKLEFWEGFRFGFGDEVEEARIRAVTGFKKLKPIADFERELGELLAEARGRVGLFWNESKKGMLPDHYALFCKRVRRVAAKKGFDASRSIANIAPAVWSKRPVLDEVDLANCKSATAITSSAFRSMLSRHAEKPFKDETQITGFLEGDIKSKSPFGTAFATIVAGGANAKTLHYTKNNSPLDRSGLVLVDFGARVQHMHADISRTFPASGKFNPLQKTIYGIVLAAQKRVEAAAKEGVTIEALNDLCWAFVAAELERRVVVEGKGKAKLGYDHAPHGVSHLIGMEVHEGDPLGNYKKTPMKSGWLISNEPGIYGDFEMSFGGKRFKESIGIRIEDNLLIERGGCKNLTSRCPKSIDAIESLLASP